MLIYLIIAIELVVLSVLFWSIYVREPKPYRVAGYHWGKYGQDKGTINSISQTTNTFSSQEEDKITYLTCKPTLWPNLPSWLVGNSHIASEFRHTAKHNQSKY